MNEFSIAGQIQQEFAFSHLDRYGRSFYKSFIIVERLSGTIDTLPIIVPEEFSDRSGWFSTTGVISGNHVFDQFSQSHHLKLNLFTRSMTPLQVAVSSNKCSLSGFICREPLLRMTYSGREICDLMIAVPRSDGLFDYVPCIFWGENAYTASFFTLGQFIELYGRLQSRLYLKGDISHSVYELSVKHM